MTKLEKCILLISIPSIAFIVAAIFAQVYIIEYEKSSTNFCYHGKPINDNKSVKQDTTFFNQSKQCDSNSYNPPRTYRDFLYFSIQTISTCGYGDITVNSLRLRVIVIIEIFIGLILLSALVAVIASILK